MKKDWSKSYEQHLSVSTERLDDHLGYQEIVEESKNQKLFFFNAT